MIHFFRIIPKSAYVHFAQIFCPISSQKSPDADAFTAMDSSDAISKPFAIAPMLNDLPVFLFWIQIRFCYCFCAAVSCACANGYLPKKEKSPVSRGFFLFLI